MGMTVTRAADFLLRGSRGSSFLALGCWLGRLLMSIWSGIRGAIVFGLWGVLSPFCSSSFLF